MIIDSLQFRGRSCFRNNWIGFSSIKPVNVIIGRNNSGKSQLIDTVSELCGSSLPNGWEYRCRGVLDEQSLRRVFPENTSAGELKGNHWTDHGRLFLGKTVAWQIHGGSPNDVRPVDFAFDSKWGERSTEARRNQISQALTGACCSLSGRRFRRLTAERDIQPESLSNSISLNPNGAGATNIVRKYLTTTNVEYPREVIQRTLLEAFNEIFGSDGRFTEIIVRIHDDGSGARQDKWEVFLTEDKKGPIALSASGSGLKTILLVLLNLLVVPHFEKVPAKDFVFAFEELENNVHPALLRRLLRFVEAFVVHEGTTMFLTTHASTALDVFGVSDHAQIIHVTHDGESAHTHEISAHFDKMNVISQLGVKPSDLLQANGVVWLEGPSDRVYMNRWIELFSAGRLREGRDYQCAFYGGALLARSQFTSPDDEQNNLANLLRINPNVVVVCDSDLTAASGPGSELKARAARIREEVDRIPNAHAWVTQAKEIENYLPGTAIGEAFECGPIPDPGIFESFFPSQRADTTGQSFLEAHLKRKTIDKVELALCVSPCLSQSVLESRFDLPAQIQEIIEKINSWNS